MTRRNPHPILLTALAALCLLRGVPAGAEVPDHLLERLGMPDQVETRIGTLEFVDGLPTGETVAKAYDFLDFHRAVDIFLDEMPAASMAALRSGHRYLGVKYSRDVLITDRLMSSESLWLTPDTETVYASAFLDLKADGPTVIDVPPGVLGFLDDMWMRHVGDIGRAGPDKGQGGRYLVLPPGHEGEIPRGHWVYRSRTWGVWLLLRGFPVDGDPKPTVTGIRRGLRIYPLARAKDRPKMNFANISGWLHNTIHSNDAGFFDELNALVQEEHEHAIDARARGRLALIGIVKGQPFEPDDRLRAILDEAARVGATIARSLLFAARDPATWLYEGDPNWFNPLAIGSHEFLADGRLHRDARTGFLYGAIGITPAMAVAMPGVGSQYAASVRDAGGSYLDGSKSYRLRLPPGVPAKDFWSIVLYDTQTRSLLQTDDPFPSLNSEQNGVGENADGSIDVSFGPEAPAGREDNWIQTVPGKGFFVILRLYGPLEPWFDKTWKPGKIELLD